VSRDWKKTGEYEDILFDYYNGIARITINRERYRNAFTPTTTGEMSGALRICREDAGICVVVITGAGDATLPYYLTDEAQEGKQAFLGKRKPDFKQYPKFP